MPDEPTSLEEFRLERMATRVAEKVLGGAFDALGLGDKASINEFRINNGWTSEQRRRGALLADAARKAMVERLVTWLGVLLTAGAVSAVVVYFGLKSTHL